jgi:hypothetical protein
MAYRRSVESGCFNPLSHPIPGRPSAFSLKRRPEAAV